MAELTELEPLAGLGLIYDRSERDVERLAALYRKGWASMSISDKVEWLAASHKGAYNYTDLNRVGEAVNYVAERLCEWGYPYHPNMRTNWSADDLVFVEDLREYLAAVDNLRCRLAVPADTPETPQRVSTVDEANAIEKIIADVYQLLLSMVEGLPYCNTIYSGIYPQ